MASGCSYFKCAAFVAAVLAAMAAVPPLPAHAAAFLNGEDLRDICRARHTEPGTSDAGLFGDYIIGVIDADPSTMVSQNGCYYSVPEDIAALAVVDIVRRYLEDPGTDLRRLCFSTELGL